MCGYIIVSSFGQLKQLPKLPKKVYFLPITKYQILPRHLEDFAKVAKFRQVWSQWLKEEKSLPTPSFGTFGIEQCDQIGQLFKAYGNN